MNNIELYKNKKFDVLNIISMVFKRKQWGKIHTLYSTPTHDVLTVMKRTEQVIILAMYIFTLIEMIIHQIL